MDPHWESTAFMEDLRARVHQQVQPRLERLVEALELAVGLGMMRGAIDVPNPEGSQVVLEGRGQVAGAPVGEESCSRLDRQFNPYLRDRPIRRV